VVVVGTTKAPAAAEPQAAGETLFAAQFDVVKYAGENIAPDGIVIVSPLPLKVAICAPPAAKERADAPPPYIPEAGAPEKLYEGAAALPSGANSGKLGVPPPPVFIIALMI